jgi:hypothetical protein
MNNQITFVTCIYDDLYGNEFGGRPHPTRRYYYGIESQLKMGNPFVIYTWPKDVQKITDYFKEFLGDEKFIKLIKVEEYDLNTTEIRGVLKKAITENIWVPGDRPYDVMIGKFIMMQKAIESNFFNTELFFWIDAGLSHQALFPDKYLDINSGDRRWSSCSLFTPKVPIKLIESAQDKILVFKINAIGHYFNKEHLAEEDWHGAFIIGGIFGGKKDIFKTLCIESINKFLYFLNEENTLYIDEQILTIIYSNNKQNFNVIEFDTWYHENSGDWVKDFIIGKKNFYKLFEDFNYE